MNNLLNAIINVSIFSQSLTLFIHYNNLEKYRIINFKLCVSFKLLFI